MKENLLIKSLNWIKLKKTSIMNWGYIIGFVIAINEHYMLEFLVATTAIGLIFYWKELNKLWRFGANLHYNFSHNTYRKLAKIKGKRKDVDLFENKR